MAVATKADIRRITKRKVLVKGGEFTYDDEGMVVKHKGSIKAGDTQVVRIPNRFTLRYGLAAYVMINPYLYEIGTVTGPAMVYGNDAEVFFRFESDEDLNFEDLEYTVKLIFTKED